MDCAAGRDSFVLFNLPAVLSDIARGRGPYIAWLFPQTIAIDKLRALVASSATPEQLACSISVIPG